MFRGRFSKGSKDSLSPLSPRALPPAPQTFPETAKAKQMADEVRNVDALLAGGQVRHTTTPPIRAHHCACEQRAQAAGVTRRARRRASARSHASRRSWRRPLGRSRCASRSRASCTRAAASRCSVPEILSSLGLLSRRARSLAASCAVRFSRFHSTLRGLCDAAGGAATAGGAAAGAWAGRSAPHGAPAHDGARAHGPRAHPRGAGQV